MPFAKVNHIQLYYEQHGSGDDLIFIGGLTSDHNVWKSALRLLSPHFRITIFDNRGAGQSDTPNQPYTTREMAQDVIGLMDALKIQRAHIAGHSMGGCIAQQIAIHYPEKINKLITICARDQMSAMAEMILSFREKLSDALALPGRATDSLIAEYSMPFLFSENFLSNTVMVKGFIQWTNSNPYPQSAIGFKNQLHAVKNHNTSEELHRIKAPTLIIAGEEDVLAQVKTLSKMRDKIKHCEFKVFSDCAHMPHVEKSKEFAEIVLEFLT